MFGVTCEGLRLKINQHPCIRIALFETGDLTMAECTERDLIWGIGLRLNDREALDQSKWRGENLLGRAWMAVRKNLKKQREGPMSTTKVTTAVHCSSPHTVRSQARPLPTASPEKTVSMGRPVLRTENRFELLPDLLEMDIEIKGNTPEEMHDKKENHNSYTRRRTKKGKSSPSSASREDSAEGACYTIADRHEESQSPQITITMIHSDDSSSEMSMLVDTGAGVSIMNNPTYEALAPLLPSLRSTPLRLKSYSGDDIPVRGVLDLLVSVGGKREVVKLYVVKHDGPNLFGMSWVNAFSPGHVWPLMSIGIRRRKKQRAGESHPSCTKLVSDLYQVEIDEQSRSLLENILTKYKVLFDEPEAFVMDGGLDAGYTQLREPTFLNIEPVNIYLDSSATPIYRKNRPLPLGQQELVKTELKTLAQNGIIYPVSHSEWASPLVIVRKPNGEIRMCGDYKVTVNKYITYDQYRIPLVDDLMCKVVNCRYFTKLDLRRAYHQIPLTLKAQGLTTVSTPYGLFRYRALPFGFSNAPSQFQRTMDSLLGGVEGVCVFQDDILIYAETIEKHLEILRKVLQILLSNNLRLSKSKCEILAESIAFLGHNLSSKGVSPVESKIEALIDTPIPTSPKLLHSFLGLVNYYAKFIPKLSEKVRPLYRLIRKGAKWQWTEEFTNIIEEIKTGLSQLPILSIFDPGQHTVLYTDASPVGLGAVLSQRDSFGNEHPVYYASKSLTPAETNYSQIEKEGLAIVWAVRRFHQFLYLRRFEICTDHRPLLKLFGPHEETPQLVASRLVRWSIILSGYDYCISYIDTRKMPADFLSRTPQPLRGNDEENCLHIASICNAPPSAIMCSLLQSSHHGSTTNLNFDTTRVQSFSDASCIPIHLLKTAKYTSLIPKPEEMSKSEFFSKEDLVHEVCIMSNFSFMPVTYRKVKKCTQSDPTLLKIMQYCKTGWPQYKSAPPEVRPYLKNRLGLGVTQGLVTWGNRVVLPERLRPRYLAELHDGHQGVTRTKGLAREHVWWPGLGKEIESQVSSCIVCAAAGRSPAQVEINPMPWPREPWSRLHLDLAGPFLGLNFLVIVDSHSKWLEVKIVKSTSSQVIVNKLSKLFSYWGYPHILVSDNGPQFVSEEYAEFCRSHDIHNTTVSPYHPRSNGQAERCVATFKNFLVKLKDRTNIKQSLNNFLLKYRITPHSMTGQSPSLLMLGRSIRTDLDLIHPSQNSLERKQENAVKRGPHAIRVFDPRDQVWYINFRASKDQPKYLRGTICRRSAPQTYIIIDDSGKSIYRHSDQIKLFGVGKNDKCSPGVDVLVGVPQVHEAHDSLPPLNSTLSSENTYTPYLDLDASDSEAAGIPSFSECQAQPQGFFDLNTNDYSSTPHMQPTKSSSVTTRTTSTPAPRGVNQGKGTPAQPLQCYGCGGTDHVYPQCPNKRPRAPLSQYQQRNYTGQIRSVTPLMEAYPQYNKPLRGGNSSGYRPWHQSNAVARTSGAHQDPSTTSHTGATNQSLTTPTTLSFLNGRRLSPGDGDGVDDEP